MHDIHVAAERGDVAAIQQALANGAAIDGIDRLGYTALHTAVRFDRIPAIIALLEAGADVDAANNLKSTPLHTIGSFYGREKVAEILLAAGADPLWKNKLDCTPIGNARDKSLGDYLQSVADGATPRLSGAEVGLDMTKRHAALQALGKPVGNYGRAEVARALQRRAALRDGQGI